MYLDPHRFCAIVSTLRIKGMRLGHLTDNPTAPTRNVIHILGAFLNGVKGQQWVSRGQM